MLHSTFIGKFNLRKRQQAIECVIKDVTARRKAIISHRV
jgi:hypothetical protein